MQCMRSIAGAWTRCFASRARTSSRCPSAGDFAWPRLQTHIAIWNRASRWESCCCFRERQNGAAQRRVSGSRPSVRGDPGTPNAAMRRDPHLLVVALVVFLGAIEHRGRDNLSDDGPAELARLIEALQ